MLLERRYFKFPLLFFAIFLSALLQGQDEKKKFIFKNLLEIDFTPDSNYITPYFEKVNFSLELEGRDFALNVNNPIREEFQLTYRPNLPVNFGLALDYSWLSLYINLRTLQSASNLERKGESRQFAFRFGVNRRALWSNVFYLNFRGLYLENPELVFYDWNFKEQGYLKRPDLRTYTFFANTTYAFNAKRFSYRAALWQSELQHKSAGSPIIGLFMRFNGTKSIDQKSFIPNDAFLFPSNADLIKFNSFNIGVNVGYTYTFVFLDHLFLTLSVWPGLLAQNGSYILENRTSGLAGFEINSQVDSRFILGFNHPDFYFGYSFQSINFSGNDNFGGIIQHNYSWSRLFFGFRVTAPESMQKAFKKVENMF
jgi:hypothetical protein